MIPPSLIAWILFLGLAHVTLMSPTTLPAIIVCTLFLIVNTLNLSVRQYNFFQAAKIAGKNELKTLTTSEINKIKEALALTRKHFGETPKVYILKGDEPNACACPIKEKGRHVVGLTSIGAKTWTCEEIVAVLGHELGHLDYKHASKTINLQIGLELLLYSIIICLCASLHYILKYSGYAPELGWFILAPVILSIAPYGLNIISLFHIYKN